MQAEREGNGENCRAKRSLQCWSWESCETKKSTALIPHPEVQASVAMKCQVWQARLGVQNFIQYIYFKNSWPEEEGMPAEENGD